MSYRTQKNITINNEQKKFIKENFDKMNISELSKMLGLGYSKVYHNLRIIGLKKEITKPAKVIDMNGYFDVDEFFKYYEY